MLLDFCLKTFCICLIVKCLCINFNARTFLDLAGTENVRTPSGHVERHVTNLIVRRPFTRFYNLTTFDSCGGRRLSYGWLCGEVIVKVIRLGWASVKSTLRTSIFLRVCSIVFSIVFARLRMDDYLCEVAKNLYNYECASKVSLRYLETSRALVTCRQHIVSLPLDISVTRHVPVKYRAVTTQLHRILHPSSSCLTIIRH